MAETRRRVTPEVTPISQPPQLDPTTSRPTSAEVERPHPLVQPDLAAEELNWDPAWLHQLQSAAGNWAMSQSLLPGWPLLWAEFDEPALSPEAAAIPLTSATVEAVPGELTLGAEAGLRPQMVGETTALAEAEAEPTGEEAAEISPTLETPPTPEEASAVEPPAAEAGPPAEAEAGLAQEEAGVGPTTDVGPTVNGLATAEEAPEEPEAGLGLVTTAMAPVPPLILPTAPPLPAPRIETTFTAPRTLLLNAMREAMGSAFLEQAQETLTDVERRVRVEQTAIQRKHDSIAIQGRWAIQDIARQYAQLQGEVPVLLSSADAMVNVIFQMTLQQVTEGAAAAITGIDASYQAARRQVIGAAAAARRAVRRNTSTAQSQINTVVNDLTQGRLNTINIVNDDVAQYSFYADDQIRQWRETIATTYPDEGTDLEVVEHESYRAAAPDIATRAQSSVADHALALSEDLVEASHQVTTNVQSTVGPPLQKRADLAGTKGIDRINRTFRITLRQLEQQAEAARTAVSDMLSSTIGQLSARRRVVRVQLEQAAQRAVTAAHQQSSTAITQIATSLEQTLPRYGGAVESLHETLVGAAEGGPEALQATAAEAIPGVAAAITIAFIAQQEQRQQIVRGVQTGIMQERSQLTERLDTIRTEGIQALGEAAQLSLESLQTTATSMTVGFATAASGVNQVAAAWATPLSQVYASFIASVRQDLKAADPEFFSGLEQHTRPFREWVVQFNTPQTFFVPPLRAAFAPVYENLEQRAGDVTQAIDNPSFWTGIDESALVRPLRGLTRARGRGLQHVWREKFGSELIATLRVTLRDFWGDYTDDYYAAMAYLRGDPAAGARYELRASLGFFNDDEARIEEVMRALSPEQISDLSELDETLGSDVLGEVHNALDGTDREAFDALRDANYALADAHRMREELDRARQQDDQDAVSRILTEYSTGRRADIYAYQPEGVSAEERWHGVIREFAGLRGVRAASTEEATHAEAVRDYILRDVEVVRSAGEAGTYTETLRVEGRQRDLVSAIVLTGAQSIQTRVARLGVETERRGGPDILNLDTALVDERLNPDYGGPNISPEERQAAREQALRDREMVLTEYARQYGGSGNEVELNTARANLIQELRERAGEGARGDLATALVREDYPTPATAAIAMEYAQEGVGTREDVIWRFTERMNRDEIARMRRLYDAGGRDLYADLGVFGQGGWFTELSGDERLRAERAMLGQPRNDRERAEVAAFTMHQQRDETGAIGEWWAEGSYSERALAYQERRLRELTGTPITFGPEGMPIPRDPEAFANAFDESGRFTGDPAEFAATMLGARLASENYAAKVDHLSQAVTTTIAIVGVIVAGVVTVATGGAASPLLLAAIAGVTGLTAMGAQAAIRGGRYGWEQAAVDLGMTAVDALTAGVGQGLSLASRGGAAGLRAGLGLARGAGGRSAGLLAQMSIRNARRLAVQNVDDTIRLLGNMGRLTGGPFGDQLLIGAGTGALGSLGRTALDENTYARGGERAVDNLFASLFRGMASGVVTAGLTNVFDLHPRLENLGSSTRVLDRSLYQAATNALGGFGGRAMELAIEAGHGQYRGDAGDIFIDSLQAAAQSGLQSGIEGGLSALAQRGYNRFARPYDEQLQANQLRRQIVDSFGDPERMRQVLDQVAIAPPGVRALLLAPPDVPIPSRVLAEAGVPAEIGPRPLGSPATGEAAEVGTTVPPGAEPGVEPTLPRAPAELEAPPLRPAAPAAGELPAVTRETAAVPEATFRPVGEPEAPPLRPAAPAAEEVPTVTPETADVAQASARRAVDQQEAAATAESPSRLPSEPVMVPDSDGNPVPAASLLPPDLRNRTPIVRDPALTGNAVHVHHSPQIHIRIGPDATAADIAAHAVTARDMHRARGLLGLVRRAYDVVVGSPRPGTVAGEAYQELDKLPAIIEDRMDQMRRATDPAEQQRLQQELANLYGQYRRQAEAAMSGDENAGRGFVAMEDTTTQIRRLYDDRISDATVRQIEADLAQLFPDIGTQERVLTTLIGDATTSVEAKTALVSHLHHFTLQLESPVGQEADFQHLAARTIDDLASNDPATRAGSTLLLRYLSDNHRLIIDGTKSAADLNTLVELFGPQELSRIAGLHEALTPKDVLEPLGAVTRTLDVSTEVDLDLRLRLIDLGESATNRDVNDVLGERSEIRAKLLPEEVLGLIDYVQGLGIENPIGELARQVRRIRLQDPEATITVQRIREAIDIDRSIAEMVRRGEFDTADLYARLHMTEEIRTEFNNTGEVYEFFRNKARAGTETVDQSFQANPFIEALASTAGSVNSQALLTRWRALHQFILDLDITVNGSSFSYTHRRSLLGHVWEDLYLRTTMNTFGPPDTYHKGNLWSYHVRIQGANFDRVLITRSGYDVVVEIADAKLSSVSYTLDQQRVEPRLKALQASTEVEPLTLEALQLELSDGSGSGTGISHLLDQLVRDAFQGTVPPQVRFRVRMHPPVESSE